MTRDAGFSLLEVAASLTLAVFLVMSVQATMMSSVRARKMSEHLAHRQDQAWGYVQRLRSIPFGTGNEGDPTPEQLTEVFDDDPDLGTITFRQVATPAGSAGRTFTARSGDQLVRWRVAVSNDLDGDGATTGFREGRIDLFRIEVWADGALMFRTLRAADVANSLRD